MKKLIIIRHAKSSWEYDVIDHERPLNERGLNDTRIISNYLNSMAIKPDLILSSDAVRAKTTAHNIVSALDIVDKKIILDHDLYDFSGGNLLQVIKNCADSINELIIFGHNHAITYLVNTYGDRYIENVPTCGVVILEFDILKWGNLKPGTTIKTVFPKDLK